MVGIPPIIGAGVGPLGMGPHHEEIIRRAGEDARRLELEDRHRANTIRYEQGHPAADAYEGIEIPIANRINEIIKPQVTPGRQDPNEIITREMERVPPYTPPYQLFQPPVRPPLGQPPQPAVGKNPFLPRRPVPPQG